MSGVNSDARGQQRGEMEDEIDLELREHALENRLVGDGAGELAADLRRQAWFERGDVDGDDRAVRLWRAG